MGAVRPLITRDSHVMEPKRVRRKVHQPAPPGTASSHCEDLTIPKCLEGGCHFSKLLRIPFRRGQQCAQVDAGVEAWVLGCLGA